MNYIIRFKIRKRSRCRVSGGNTTYLVEKGRGPKRFRVGADAANGMRATTKDEAAGYAEKSQALDALCEYLKLSNWNNAMWVKDPQIVRVED